MLVERRLGKSKGDSEMLSCLRPVPHVAVTLLSPGGVPPGALATAGRLGGSGGVRRGFGSGVAESLRQDGPHPKPGGGEHPQGMSVVAEASAATSAGTEAAVAATANAAEAAATNVKNMFWKTRAAAATAPGSSHRERLGGGSGSGSKVAARSLLSKGGRKKSGPSDNSSRSGSSLKSAGVLQLASALVGAVWEMWRGGLLDKGWQELEQEEQEGLMQRRAGAGGSESAGPASSHTVETVSSAEGGARTALVYSAAAGEHQGGQGGQVGAGAGGDARDAALVPSRQYWGASARSSTRATAATATASSTISTRATNPTPITVASSPDKGKPRHRRAKSEGLDLLPHSAPAALPSVGAFSSTSIAGLAVTGPVSVQEQGRRIVSSELQAFGESLVFLEGCGLDPLYHALLELFTSQVWGGGGGG